MATKKPAESEPTTAKKTTSKATASKASAAKKTTASKTTASKTTASKATASKATTAKTAASKTTASKASAAKKTTASKAPASKATASKTTASKATTAKTAASKATASKASAAKKTTASRSAAAKASTAKVDEAPAKPASRSRRASKYSVGDKVVHPQHGAATIAKKVKQEFAGEKLDYFVLDIATEQLTVMVPVSNIEDVIRPIISKTQARNVLKVLKQEPQEAGSNWSRWYKVLNEKMTSGDIFQVAEVVRDLNYAQQTKGISPALKRMFSKARISLTSELEFALVIDEEEALKKLERALPEFEPIES